MSTASFKLKGQRLVGKWISIEYEEEGKPVWYKARVDTYGGAQKYEVTWEAPAMAVRLGPCSHHSPVRSALSKERVREIAHDMLVYRGGHQLRSCVSG